MLILVGVDPSSEAADRSAAALERFTDFYLRACLMQRSEVLRATQYLLIQPDPRGDLGPQWLTLFETADASPHTAEALVRTLPNSSVVRWRQVWSPCSGYEGVIGMWGRPYLFLIGMDVPGGTRAADLAAFNDFYDSQHLPEVTDVLGYHQALRYERVEAVDTRGLPSPRFLALYDGDEEVIRRQVQGIPQGAIRMDGPRAWNERETRWRLIYRRHSGAVRPLPL